MPIADSKAELQDSFEMSDLGHLHHYLGISFKQVDGGIALCQNNYNDMLLQCFGFEHCKPIATPMKIWTLSFFYSFYAWHNICDQTTPNLHNCETQEQLTKIRSLAL